MVERALYQAEFDEAGSSGSAVRLLQRSGARGVVVDLGCGYGHVAEPIRELGLTYVGLDIDERALADLRERGFEAGPVDLELPQDELVAAVDRALDGRPLGALLALDVLEHLVHPDRCAAALASVARSHPGAELIVSIPNVTHLEVAAKALLGRWEMLPIGLLDRTHLQFFDVQRSVTLLADAGWGLVDVEDVIAVVTEQCTMPDAPHLRPGAPLRDALESIRLRSDPHGHTYQFVRRYRLGPSDPSLEPPLTPASDDGPLVAVVLDEAASNDIELLDSLRRQTDPDLVVVSPSPPPDLPSRACGEGGRLADIRAVGARYVAMLSGGSVMAPTWVADLRRLAAAAPGRVVTFGCAEPATDAPRLDIARLELLGVVPSGLILRSAYALPAAALIDGGLGGLDADWKAFGTTVARCVMWCGRVDSDEVTVRAPRASAVELEVVLASIVAELDEEPTIHGAGGLGSAITTSRHLRAVSDELHDLKARQEVLARARDTEVAELHARIARLSTPWGALGFATRRAASGMLRLVRRTWSRGPRA